MKIIETKQLDQSFCIKGMKVENPITIEMNESKPDVHQEFRISKTDYLESVPTSYESFQMPIAPLREDYSNVLDKLKRRLPKAAQSLNVYRCSIEQKSDECAGPKERGDSLKVTYHGSFFQHGQVPRGRGISDFRKL